MTNSMTDCNVRIIHDLKNFLKQSMETQSQKEKHVSSSKDFTRNRTLTFSLLVMLILNTLKRSLSIELENFFDCFSTYGCCTKQAFSAQRSKLNPQFFHDWNQELVTSFYKHNKETFLKWNGFKLWVVDGSSVPVPDTEATRNNYGFTTNQQGKGSIVARICVLYDVLNRIAIKGFLHPYTVSEEDVTLTLFEDQDLRDTLLLFDRGYLSYWLIYQLLSRDTYFVFRAARNANNTVKSFLASKQMDITLDIYPPYCSLKKLSEMGINITKESAIKIRLVKVILETGEVEILVTNLYDTALYTREDLKAVYHLRWGIETYYGYLKEELQLGQFSGIRPICIEQDFAANLFLSNLQSLIEKQCEPYLKAISRKRKYEYKINKNISWNSLKYRVVKLFLFENSSMILYELEKLFVKYLEPIRPGRRYKRLKKRRPNAKNYTLTNYKRAI